MQPSQMPSAARHTFLGLAKLNSFLLWHHPLCRPQSHLGRDVICAPQFCTQPPVKGVERTFAGLPRGTFQNPLALTCAVLSLRCRCCVRHPDPAVPSESWSAAAPGKRPGTGHGASRSLGVPRLWQASVPAAQGCVSAGRRCPAPVLSRHSCCRRQLQLREGSNRA